MSKPQVTITLGRTGQKVVKRPQMEYGGGHTDAQPLSGSKRSVRERFGSNSNNSFSPMNKRLRGDANSWSSINNGADGNARVGRNDLRLKLMRKKLSRQKRSEVEDRKKMDLRERMSRTVRSQEQTYLRRSSPTRRASEQQPAESYRNYPSSPYGADGLRSRPPYRDLKVYRGISPPRNIEERRVPLMRPYDASRTAPRIMGDDSFYSSRPTGTVPTTTRTTLDTGKPAGLQSASMPKISYTGEQPLTVGGLLHSLGLGKYAVLFQAEEVDMAALRQMGDKDLKELGIPMGPRKKILLATLPRSTIQQR